MPSSVCSYSTSLPSMRSTPIAGASFSFNVRRAGMISTFRPWNVKARPDCSGRPATCSLVSSPLGFFSFGIALFPLAHVLKSCRADRVALRSARVELHLHRLFVPQQVDIKRKLGDWTIGDV